MPYEHIATAGDENKIMAWQNRGEVISVSHQLPSHNPVTGQEVVPITQNLSTQQNQKHSLNVLEGIAVFNNQPQQLSDNPYLQAAAEFKKAA